MHPTLTLPRLISKSIVLMYFYFQYLVRVFRPDTLLVASTSTETGLDNNNEKKKKKKKKKTEYIKIVRNRTQPLVSIYTVCIHLANSSAGSKVYLLSSALENRKEDNDQESIQLSYTSHQRHQRERNTTTK